MDEHRKYLDALQSGDGFKAYQIMIHHLMMPLKIHEKHWRSRFFGYSNNWWNISRWSSWVHPWFFFLYHNGHTAVLISSLPTDFQSGHYRGICRLRCSYFAVCRTDESHPGKAGFQLVCNLFDFLLFTHINSIVICHDHSSFLFSTQKRQPFLIVFFNIPIHFSDFLNYFFIPLPSLPF